MFNGLQQGASQIAQGAILYILDRKPFSISEASVVNVSQPHISKSAQSNPLGAFQNLVVDLTLSSGGETTTIEFPINSVTASYPDKGWFVSTDKAAITKEVESVSKASEQFLQQKGWHEMVLEKAPTLIMQLHPEKQKEAQQAQEIEEIKNRVSEIYGRMDQLVSLFSAANPANSKKEE